MGAKTIPLAKGPDPLGPTRPVPTAGVSAAPGAPVPPAAPPAGASPVGAKTIPLAKAPGSAGPAPVGKSTTPLQPGGAKPLPAATVKMGAQALFQLAVNDGVALCTEMLEDDLAALFASAPAIDGYKASAPQVREAQSTTQSDSSDYDF